MDKFDRIQKLHHIFSGRRRPVSMRILAEEMDCSRSTVERTIEDMRNYLNLPIAKSADGSWYYEQSDGETIELPGLWLTPDELQSLVLLINLLERLGSGLIADELKVIHKQIDKLLTVRGIAPSTINDHFKILPLGNKPIPGKVFTAVGTALLKNKTLHIRYSNYDGKTSSRTISPQNLVYYRDNWYLDAWCHKRRDLRTFALARIDHWRLTETKPVAVSQADLKKHFEKGYGIFAGSTTDTAVLRFNPAIARDIAAQQWHPEQVGKWNGEYFELSLPYSDERELVGDILRHLPHVQVLGPEKLKIAVKERLSAAIEIMNQETE